MLTLTADIDFDVESKDGKMYDVVVLTFPDGKQAKVFDQALASNVQMAILRQLHNEGKI